MNRLQGTLTLQRRKGRSEGNRGGLYIGSILAGAAETDNCNREELQIWTEQILRSVREYDYRQRQRAACDRARLIVAQRELFNAR